MQQEPFRPRLDAHFHLQTIPWNSCFADIPGRNILDSFILKGNMSICNGTSPLDWDLLTALVRLYPINIIPFYGVHPWYVDALPGNWLDNLTSYLVKSGLGIGEIGLDRSSSSKASFGHQLDVFEAQIELALSMNLPVAIHCVRAWGILLEILQDKIQINIDNDIYSKIPVMVHSFSGSIDIMKQLTDMGVYISFSPHLISVKAEPLRELVKAVPVERILIESDFSYSKNIPVNNQILDYNRNLSSLYQIAGSLKDMDPEYFQEVVLKNGKVFTDRAPYRHR